MTLHLPVMCSTCGSFTSNFLMRHSRKPLVHPLKLEFEPCHLTLKFTKNYMFKLFSVLLICKTLIHILWWKKNIKLFLLTNNKLLFYPNKIQINNHVKLGTFKLFVGWTFHHFIRHLLFPYGQYLTQLNATEHKVSFVFIYFFIFI